MHKGIFSRLAKQNIRNNKSTYIPYMITCIFCIAMIYMMEFLRDCPTLDQAVRQADEVRMIVFTGEIVVEIFCIIFLIYSNSFLMKRRQKEIGLYNILGLERNHIGIVMFLETIITSIGSLAGGIAAGIIGSKLALLLLLKLLHIPSVLGFYISVKGIFTCLFMFGIIFLMILFLNLAKIHLSRPVELLRGNNTGEKEPVAKWLMALIGFICLGAGYYLAVTTESPIKAITIFLLAVILVMAGTYLLFTAGSIVILKFLRRRKSFYYRTGNFISISGMLYRMKQNAIGLASICILSTGVLLMISMTVSIYFGMNDIMLNRYPYDVDMSVTSISEEECQTAIEAFEKAIADNKVPVEKSVEEIYLDIVCSKNGDQILIKPANTIRNSDSVLVLSLLDQAEYERLTGISANLNDGEIFAWYPSAVQKDSVTVDETEFTVKKWLDKNPLTCGEDAVSDNAVLVVTDEDFKKFDEMRTEMYKGVSSAPAGEDLTLHLGLDITGSETDKIDFGTPVMEVVKDLKKNGGLSENSWITSGIRQQEYESYYADNGSLLFIGIFLGSLFLMGTAMIIYYKQISEGYEDQKRFEIMQKGGQKFCPQTDSDGIFPPAVNGNASYYHGISNDPKNAPALWNDKYEAVYWMYGGNSIDLCCCVWVDLSYDGAFLLSYCREKIIIQQAKQLQ